MNAVAKPYVSEKQRKLERTIASELSPEKAYQWVEKQVKISERLTGTPQGLEEVELIRDALIEYGIETKIMEFDAHVSIPAETQLKVIAPGTLRH